MEEYRKTLFNKNYTALIDAIKYQIEDVCNYLQEKRILSTSMKENVMCRLTPTKKATYFFDRFDLTSNKSFAGLYEACSKLHLSAATKILYEGLDENQKYRFSPKEEERPLPDKWPNEEQYNIVMRDKLDVKKVLQGSNMFKKYQSHLNYTTSIYPTHHEVRGNALIINNDEFPFTKFENRHGSEPDKKGLVQLFNGLGFKVTLENNKTKEEVEELIDIEKKENHRDHDCFVFYFLSYGTTVGNSEMVKDKKGNNIDIQDLVSAFIDVEDLKGKPKLFFFQACRGGNEPKAVEANASGVQQAGHDEDDERLGSSKHDGAESIKGGVDSSPIHYPDVFQFRSTSKYSVAYRNTKLGSWFTQAVIYIFAEYACKANLSTLQLKINDLLSHAAETVEGQKNISDTDFIPGREFYFFPGLHGPK